MMRQVKDIDFRQLARDIHTDPAGTYTWLYGCFAGPAFETSIPDHMQSGLARYLILGILPGGFLRAVLSNDLMEAAVMADDINRPRLFDFVLFLKSYAPKAAYGSPEAMHEWSRRGGALEAKFEEEPGC